jgi:hypothetical protein
LNLPGDAPISLQMDSAERLYVLYGAGSFMWLEGGLEFTTGYSMAFDDETNQLFFQFM